MFKYPKYFLTCNMCCLLTMFNMVQSYSNNFLLTFVFRHDLPCRTRSDDDAQYESPDEDSPGKSAPTYTRASAKRNL